MERLFLGGPYDGEVMEVKEASIQEIPEPPGIESWFGERESGQTHLYRLRGIHVNGGTVHAMVSEEEDIHPYDPRLHKEQDGVEFRPYSR